MTVAKGETADRRRLLASIAVTRTVAIRLLAVSIWAFSSVIALGDATFSRMGTSSLQPVSVTAGSPLEVLVGVALFVGLVVVVVVPHELLHGLFMARYGGSPEYGVGARGLLLPRAYARTQGAIYTRNQMLVVLLAPVLIITAVGFALAVAFESSLVIVPVAANAAGSIGDLWMAAIVGRYPASVRIAEPPEGYDGSVAIYGFEDARKRDSALSSAVASWLYATAGAYAATVAGLLASVLAALAFGSGDVTLEDPVTGAVAFRHELDAGGGASLEVGFPTLFALSAAGGVAWVVVSALYGRLTDREKS